MPNRIIGLNGFSISLLELDQTSKKALFSDVGVANWPGIREHGSLSTVEAPLAKRKSGFEASNNEAIQGMVLAVCEMLVAATDDLNKLDARIGDGDTGTTFGNAARCIMNELDNLPFADGAQLCLALSDLLTRHMGGTSGALMAILFAAAGESYERTPAWPSAFLDGAERMMFYGGARPGDRTMLDSLVPALETLQMNKTIDDAATAARNGADETAIMKVAKAGRASYVPADNLSGIVDPGSEAVARVFARLSALT